MCRETRMAVAAAQLAIADAGFAEKPMDPETSGVVLGSDYMLTMPEDYEAGMKNVRRRRRVRIHALGQRRPRRDGPAVDAQVSAQHAGQPHRDLQRPPRPEQLAHHARSGRQPGHRRSVPHDPARPRQPDGRRRHRHAHPADAGDPRAANRADGRRELRPHQSQPPVRQEPHRHGRRRRRRHGRARRTRVGQGPRRDDLRRSPRPRQRERRRRQTCAANATSPWPAP